MPHDELERILRDTLQREVAESAPRLEGLEERILSDLGERRPRLGLVEWLGQLLAPTRGGRVGQFAIVGATAAAFLLIGLFISGDLLDRVSPPQFELAPAVASGAAPMADEDSVSGDQQVLFVVPAPLNAKTVVVVGDFNHWEETALTDDDHDGIWTATIPLAPGRYEYGFLIDGRWWGEDPRADEHVQSFGEYSSVRYVGRGGDGA